MPSLALALLFCPKFTIGDGTAVGALSLVTKSLDPWGVYFDSPVKKLKNRSKRLLKWEAELIAELEKPADSLPIPLSAIG